MNRQDFEKELQTKYPNLYTDMHGDPKQTCMAWGIDTGPGWYPIIQELSEKLEALILKMPEEERHNVKMAQCKEKFGLLRIYLSSGTDEMYSLVDEAERKSEHICETCGQPGKTHGGQWIRTHCDPCEQAHQKNRQAINQLKKENES